MAKTIAGDAVETPPEPQSETYTAMDPSLIGTGEDASAPKKRGRPRGSTNAPRDPNAPARPRGRPRGKKSLEDGIGGMLIMSNLVFGFLPAPWDGDAFTEDEVTALSRSLDAFAQDHATVYRYLSSMVAGGSASSIQLMLVVGSVANRRLNNHGMTMATLLGIKSPPKDEVADGYSGSIATE